MGPLCPYTWKMQTAQLTLVWQKHVLSLCIVHLLYLHSLFDFLWYLLWLFCFLLHYILSFELQACSVKLSIIYWVTIYCVHCHNLISDIEAAVWKPWEVLLYVYALLIFICYRDPVRSSIVEAVNNGRLLCSHGKLCAELPSTVCWDDDSTRLIMLCKLACKFITIISLHPFL